MPGDAVRNLQKLGLSVETMKACQSKVIRDIKISAIPSEHPGVLKQNGYFLEGRNSKILVLADPALTPDLALQSMDFRSRLTRFWWRRLDSPCGISDR
jgi:hypothetical protein